MKNGILTAPKALAFIFSVPIFFNATSGFSLATRYSSDLQGNAIIPLYYVILLFWPISFALKSLRSSTKFHSRSWSIVLLLSLFYVANFFLGLSLGHQSDPLKSFLRMSQSVFPLLFFLMATSLVSNTTPEERLAFLLNFLWMLGISVSVFVLLYFLSSVFWGGTSSRFSILSDHIGPFFNPKIKRFFPVLVALSALIIFTSPNRSGSLNMRFILERFLGLVCLVAVASYWSRTAVFALFVGFLPFFVFKTKSLARSAFAFLFSFASLSLFDTLPEFLVSSVIRALDTLKYAFETGGDLSFGDKTRVERMLLAVAGTFWTPFGSGFSLHIQYPLPNPDLIIAENGYLDLGVRGGFLAIILVVYILFRCLKNAFGCPFSARVHLISLVFFLWIGVMPWLHLGTETFLSPIFWFFTGLVFTLKEGSIARSIRRGSAGNNRFDVPP